MNYWQSLSTSIKVYFQFLKTGLTSWTWATKKIFVKHNYIWNNSINAKAILSQFVAGVKWATGILDGGCVAVPISRELPALPEGRTCSRAKHARQRSQLCRHNKHDRQHNGENRKWISSSNLFKKHSFLCLWKLVCSYSSMQHSCVGKLRKSSKNQGHKSTSDPHRWGPSVLQRRLKVLRISLNRKTLNDLYSHYK